MSEWLADYWSCVVDDFIPLGISCGCLSTVGGLLEGRPTRIAAESVTIACRIADYHNSWIVCVRRAGRSCGDELSSGQASRLFD